jgi:hypothetical protein
MSQSIKNMNVMKCYGDICFVPQDIAITSSKIFGFSEFLASLALLVVIFTVTDSRYKFRISIAPLPLYIITFIVITLTGFLSLISDLWVAEKWWVLKSTLEIRLMTQAILGFSFLTCFMLWMYYAFINPPKFGNRNTEKYFKALYQSILKGNGNELAIIADEISLSVERILKHANNGDKVVNRIARDILVLMANKKFCQVLVASSPRTASKIFNTASDNNFLGLPLNQFSANISEEALKNKDSIIYHEDNAFNSGFTGFIQEWSYSIYGNHKIVDALEDGHLSPFSFNYKSFYKFDSEQWSTYCRLAGVYLKSCLESNKYLVNHRTIITILKQLETCTRETYKIDKTEDDLLKNELIEKINVFVNHIKDTFEIMSKYNAKTNYNYSIEGREREQFDLHYFTSSAMFEMIFKASQIQENNFTTWHIQGNIVWDGFFRGIKKCDAYSKTRKKLVRTIYKELKQIETSPNFKNTKIAGLIMNVLGLQSEPNFFIKKDRQLIFLQKLTQKIIKQNLIRISNENPEVAENMFPKSIMFDVDKKCLIKKFPRGTRKEARSEFFYLD